MNLAQSPPHSKKNRRQILEDTWRRAWAFWDGLYGLDLNLIPAVARTKTPLVKWAPYQEERVPPDVWAAWKQRFVCPWSCNMLLLTGRRNQLVVVDSDDEAADEQVARRCPPSPVGTLTRKGRHRLYRHPGTRVPQNIGHVLDYEFFHLDVKGDGNYVVAPWSWHALGAVYKPVGTWDAATLAALPVYDQAWLPDEGSRDVAGERGRADLPDQDVAVGGCDVPLAERVLRAAQYLRSVPGTVQGQQASAKALWTAGKLALGFLLPYDQALPLLVEWGERDDQRDAGGAYYPWSAKEIGHKLRSACKNPHGYRGTPGDMCAETAAQKHEHARLAANLAVLDLALGGWGQYEDSTPPPPPPTEEPVADRGPTAAAADPDCGDPYADQEWRSAQNEAPEPAEEDDPLAADLRADGIAFQHRRDRGRDEYHVATCPCCKIPGLFYSKHGETGYYCGGGKHTWKGGKLRFAKKPGDRVMLRVPDILSLPSPRWLIQDHFLEHKLALIYGPPGTCKSFLALDMAACVASGRDFLGRYPVAPGPAVYIAAEGADGMKQRLRAWLDEKNGGAHPADLYMLGATFHLTEDAEVDAVVGLIRGALGERQPALLVIDTLARNFGPGNENEPDAMGGFIANCDKLKDTLDCTVLVVHHSGKDRSKGARAHSSLAGASDHILALTDEPGDKIKVQFEKHKDAPKDMEYLVLKRQTQWDDQNRTLVLEQLDAPAKQRPRPKIDIQSDLVLWSLLRTRQDTETLKSHVDARTADYEREQGKRMTITTTRLRQLLNQLLAAGTINHEAGAKNKDLWWLK